MDALLLTNKKLFKGTFTRNCGISQSLVIIPEYVSNLVSLPF